MPLRKVITMTCLSHRIHSGFQIVFILPTLAVDARGLAVGLRNVNFSLHAQAEQDLPLLGLDEEPDAKSIHLRILNAPVIYHFHQLVEGD
jgi:hypothetical protein